MQLSWCSDVDCVNDDSFVILFRVSHTMMKRRRLYRSSWR